MHSINLRQLRDTRQLKSWLAQGETVELRERDRVLARIVPEEKPAQPVEWPDFEARARRIFGGRQINALESFLEDREKERY